jgi:hypothetical protein
MRITFFIIVSQVILICLWGGCTKKEESPIIPPVTTPLSRDYIGFGVITSSYTHVTEEPSLDSVSVGYLRRGVVVRVVKRQTIISGNDSISWVFINDGWLKEDVMEIYEYENQARTAAENFNR